MRGNAQIDVFGREGVVVALGPHGQRGEGPPPVLHPGVEAAVVLVHDDLTRDGRGRLSPLPLPDHARARTALNARARLE